MQLVDKAYPKYGQTLKLDFAINYDLNLAEPIENNLSDFNKKLKKALNYNPKDSK